MFHVENIWAVQLIATALTLYRAKVRLFKFFKFNSVFGAFRVIKTHISYKNIKINIFCSDIIWEYFSHCLLQDGNIFPTA